MSGKIWALTFDFKRNTTLSWTVDTLATSFDRRQLSSDGFGNSIYAMADFGLSGIIINDEHRTFSIDAGITSSFDRSKRRMLTIDEIYGRDIDFANTFDNAWNSFSNSLNASFNYSSRHTHLSGGLSVRNTLQADDERYPQPPYSENENTCSESGMFSGIRTDFQSSKMPGPWRMISIEGVVQSTTVEPSRPPVPPSMTKSTVRPHFSSMSSGSVT